MGRTISVALRAVQAVNIVAFSAEKRVLLVERHLKQNRLKQSRVITATDLDVQHQQNLSVKQCRQTGNVNTRKSVHRLTVVTETVTD
jgi:hypothetical protein